MQGRCEAESGSMPGREGFDSGSFRGRFGAGPGSSPDPFQVEPDPLRARDWGSRRRGGILAAAAAGLRDTGLKIGDRSLGAAGRPHLHLFTTSLAQLPVVGRPG